jgi:hypothetical protein
LILASALHLISHALQHAKAYKAKGSQPRNQPSSGQSVILMFRLLYTHANYWCLAKMGAHWGEALETVSVLMFIWFDFAVTPRVFGRDFCIITLRFHLSVRLCVYPCKREVTGSHLTRAKKFSFSASLDLGHYNRRPTDTAGYGPGHD